jgi:hypothetical protein
MTPKDDSISEREFGRYADSVSKDIAEIKSMIYGLNAKIDNINDTKLPALQVEATKLSMRTKVIMTCISTILSTLVTTLIANIAI